MPMFPERASMIQNPVLTGFHPDPSMICVDGVFYIANSTFEYYPGVSISASKDLANWETVAYPLNEKRLLDMTGNPSSTGIWAPCLSYCDGLFYLVYTDVKTWAVTPFKDTPNYVTTASAVTGPWSDPVYLNCSGFDPSLFHDEDGRKYLINMEWDYRKQGDAQFTGILLTELDAATLKPIGEPVRIFTGSDRGLVEGPHLYRKDGYYYLVTAEGGTSYQHAVTVARSLDIEGPYELHPQKHLVSSLDYPQIRIQKGGHGSLCQSPDGRWWTAFLCGRPVDYSMACPLGRETSISEVIWRDGWPYLKHGSMAPPDSFEGYGALKPRTVYAYGFDTPDFERDFMSLRMPARYALQPDGALRLYGGDSLLSLHGQNMLVRRQCDFDFTAQTAVTLPFEHFQQMAGMIYRYNEENQFFLRLAYDEQRGVKTLGLLCFDKYHFSMPLAQQEIAVHAQQIHLRLKVQGRKGVFSYSEDGENFKEIPYVVDVAKLSDEYATPMGFTGAFVGMDCIDLRDKTAYADFAYFTYCVD